MATLLNNDTFFSPDENNEDIFIWGDFNFDIIFGKSVLSRSEYAHISKQEKEEEEVEVD